MNTSEVSNSNKMNHFNNKSIIYNNNKNKSNIISNHCYNKSENKNSKKRKYKEISS